MTGPGGFSCRMNAAGSALPDRERILITDHWRVAHAFDTSIAGWLVVLARRHLTSLADLDPAAAAELGPLLSALSAAQQAILGVPRSYVALFAEADGFAHLHLHVVPRAADLPVGLRGPAVFGALGVAEADAVSESERDALVSPLRAHLATWS